MFAPIEKRDIHKEKNYIRYHDNFYEIQYHFYLDTSGILISLWYARHLDLFSYFFLILTSRSYPEYFKALNQSFLSFLILENL